MATGAHELVWAAVLLDGCPNVEAIGLRVQTDCFWVADELVPVIVVDVHARSQAEAATLSRALGLAEVEGRVTRSEDYGPSVWRTWRGWVADGSREAPVWVSVTGADRMSGSAVA